MPVLPPYGNTVLPGSYGDAQGNAWDAAVGVVGPFAKAGAPVNGAVGTGDFAGDACKGALLVDTTTGNLYSNTGSITTVTWTQITIP